MPGEAEPPPKKLTLKPAEFESVNQPLPPGHIFNHDPLELLRMNRQHEIAHGTGPEPAPTPRKKSRRLREYLLLLAAVDLPMGVLFFILKDPVSHVFLIAGLGMFTAAWTWRMFVVQDDY